MLYRKSNKIFIHVDCDSFFASCEILRNPLLKDSFVCVWHEIVIACTYNCKDLWIKTWTPIWEAKRILKERLVIIKPDHYYYEEVSNKLFEYLKENTAWFEAFSIDEAFCEITWIPEYFKMSLWSYLRKLQRDILQKVWIQVSIWCAETRIKSKIYSKLNKPYWIYIWFDQEREIKLFKSLDIWKIPFIWSAYQERLKYKASNIYWFIQLWFWDLKNRIGKNATDLRLELVWVNAFVVKKSEKEKSISRTRSFNHNITNDKEYLLKQLNIHFERVFEEITNKNQEIRFISILFRTKEFETLTYSYKFAEYTNERADIHSSLLKIFNSTYNEDKLYRSIWVIFSEFRDYLPKQSSIFDKPLRSKDNNYNLYKIIWNINEKYWEHKIAFWTSLLWCWKDINLWIRK